MAVRTGLAGSFGYGAESSYGTYAAPTRFHKVASASLSKNKNIAQGGGLAAGQLVMDGERRVLTAEDGTGSVPDLQVNTKGFGLLLAHIFGSSTTPVQQGASAAYLQTHALGDNVGKALSAQVGIPDTTGTVRPYTGLGGKLTSAEFKCGGPGEMLTVSTEWDFRQISEAQTLASPSYPTGVKPFHFGQMTVKLGTQGAETSVDGVKGMSVKIERPHANDRFYAGNGGLKSEALGNDYVKVTGTITADYLDKSVFADRFANDSSTSLVWEFVGATAIASTYYPTFRIKLPMIFLDGDTPTLDGPGVISGDFPFTALFDLTNAAISAEYQSSDTTL